MKDHRSGERHVIVVGGGASGVLMAAHLLSQPAAFRVTLLEKGDLLGCGIAYATTNPDHLLNTRVHNMSAFPAQPEHFHDWLARHGDTTGPNGFVGRNVYGRYMRDLLTPWMGSPVLETVQGECLRLEETATGIRADLAGGRSIEGDIAILATGHAVPEDAGLTGAWSFSEPTDADATVLIVGSGLSMIDQVVSLLRSGHRGRIVSVSRRGLLPQAHGERVPARRSVAPPRTGISGLLHWARGIARDAEAQGGSWHDAVDSIRPHVHDIWRKLSTEERARFIRHASAWWHVHRHRMPPASFALVSDAMRSGQLELRRGSFIAAEGGRARIRPRDGGPAEIEASRIIDCRGILRDPDEAATPVIRDLLDRGEARLDPLRIGLDVALDCHLVRRDGGRTDRILAIGPVSRAAFWEITAIPDIREQAEKLAHRLSRTVVPAV